VATFAALYLQDFYLIVQKHVTQKIHIMSGHKRQWSL